MNNYNRVFGLISFIFCSVFMIQIGVSYDPTTTAGDGNSNITLEVVSPYGDILISRTIKFNNILGNPEALTPVEIHYKEFSEAFGSANPKSIYCAEGGQYKIRTILKTHGVTNECPLIKVARQVLDHRDAGEFYRTVYDYVRSDCDLGHQKDLFYCQTTRDLVDQIKIPSSWQNNDLTVYCNNGEKPGLYRNYVGVKATNFEYFTKNLDAYKVCIIKNVDLEVNNTIIYGLEVGNKLIDFKVQDLFDMGTLKGKLVDGLKDITIVREKNTQVLNLGNRTKFKPSYMIDNPNYNSNGLTNEDPKILYNPPREVNQLFYQYRVKDSQDREYDFYYENTTSLFAITDGIDFDLTTKLSDVYDFSADKYNLSRIFLVRKDKFDNVIFGYEHSGIILGLTTRLPVYIIKHLLSSSLPDQDKFKSESLGNCLKYLGKYDAFIPDGVVVSTDEVRCFENGDIDINAVGFGDTITPFNIFKNIILDFE